MNLKLQPIQILPEDPFHSDLLSRKGEIENLTTLLLNVNSPAVVAVDSRWGTGKTTLIKMWEQHLKSHDLPSLYFNAWETDFSDDPLVSFLGEMNEGLKALIGVSDKSQELWAAAKAAGKQIAKRSIPALIKVGTVGIIDAEKLVEDEIANGLSAFAGDALDDYLKQKAAISEFHESLASFIKTSSDNKPVVIFVDELDRCRPTYSIALLERIKHLFNIEGLIFVLALDKEQLGHSIEAVYGSGIDSNGYLRRFIDFEYHLKQPSIENYIDSLFGAFSLNEFFEPRERHSELQYDKHQLKSTFLMLAEFCRLSLREIEQLLACINLALRTAKENEYIHPALLAFLVVTKNFKPSLYQRYVMDPKSESILIDYLYEVVPATSRHDNHQCALIEGFLIAAKRAHYSDSEPESLVRHRRIVEDNALSSHEKQYSETVVHVVERPVGLGRGVNLDALIKRIDWVSQFQFSKR